MLHATGKTTAGGVSGDLTSVGYHSTSASLWSQPAMAPMPKQKSTGTR